MKYLTAVFIVLVLVVFNLYRAKPAENYKILKVKNADEFYVDFNRNGKVDFDELVKLYSINAFHPKNSYGVKYQTKALNCTKNEVLGLGVLAKEYAEREFTNKVVRVELKDVEKMSIKPYSTAVIHLDGKDVGVMLLNKGFATPGRKEKAYKKQFNFVNFKNNIEALNKEKIFILNRKNGIYHSLSCVKANKISNAEAFRQEYLPKNAKPCRFCILGKSELEKLSASADKKFVLKDFDFSVGSISFYFTDFNKRLKPDSECSTKGCQVLLQQINNAKESIDFAVLGISAQPKIMQALVNAQNRGVKIRWVTDENSKGENIYDDVKNAQKLLPNFKTDNHKMADGSGYGSKFANAIMHNKFFIFDNKSVWLGSANISSTDLADFNANVIIYANSKILADIFEKEFEQMYSGKFHKIKNIIPNKENLKIDDKNTVSVYFSPVDRIIERQIIPKINNASKYIYVSSFIITHKGVADALLEAKNRGVDVKLIVDATSAGGNYSRHRELRQNGVPVKVENKAGKMHAKSMVIDDKYIISGSMNLTKSGENINDENVLVIYNPDAARVFKNQFLYLYDSVPNIWLVKSPRAESPDSIGSCFDGIDNDFDGLVDKDDPGCKYATR